MVSLIVCLVACGGAEAAPANEPSPVEEVREESPVAASTASTSNTDEGIEPPAADMTKQRVAQPARTRGSSGRPHDTLGHRISALVYAINALGHDMYGQVRAREGNFVFSPAAVHLAYYTISDLIGGGPTTEQMIPVLHLDRMLSLQALPDDIRRLERHWGNLRAGTEIRLVNRLFRDDSLPEFHPMSIARVGEASTPEARPLRSSPERQRTYINRWMAQQSEGRISTLLPADSVQADTRLVHANALTFQGAWAQPFDATSTQTAAFRDGPRTTQVPMMRQTGQFRFAQVEGGSVLELPYADGQFAMLIYLPADANGLAALEQSLAETRQWQASMTARDVDVVLPRFSIENAPLDLAPILSALGMPDAFDAEDARFTMASPTSESVSIGPAFHQGVLAVDELGSSARAAASPGRLPRLNPSGPRASFRADHPFLFEVRDLRTQTLVYLGRVTQPDAV